MNKELDTLYRKTQSGKYVSVGPDLSHQTLGPGLWLIRDKKSGKSLTSVVYLLDKLRDYKLSIDDITTIEEYTDIVSESIHKKCNPYDHSFNDLTELIIAEFINVIKNK